MPALNARWLQQRFCGQRLQRNAAAARAVLTSPLCGPVLRRVAKRSSPPLLQPVVWFVLFWQVNSPLPTALLRTERGGLLVRALWLTQTRCRRRTTLPGVRACSGVCGATLAGAIMVGFFVCSSNTGCRTGTLSGVPCAFRGTAAHAPALRCGFYLQYLLIAALPVMNSSASACRTVPLVRGFVPAWVNLFPACHPVLLLFCGRGRVFCSRHHAERGEGAARAVVSARMRARCLFSRYYYVLAAASTAHFTAPLSTVGCGTCAVSPLTYPLWDILLPTLPSWRLTPQPPHGPLRSMCDYVSGLERKENSYNSL